MINENTVIKKTSALYTKYGIKSVSIDDVSFMLGISKKTIYEIIENKNELISRVVENNLDFFYAKVLQKIENENDILMNLCLVYSTVIREVKKINPSYVHDLKKYHPLQYSKIIQFRDQKIYKIIESWITKGVAAGIFRDDLDLPLVFQNQIQKISALIYNLEYDFTEPLTGQAAYMLILNDIRGITTLKGHEIFDQNYNFFLQLK